MSLTAKVDLLDQQEKLRSRAGAAMNVMRLVDDPEASAGQLAQSIAPDPVLAARLLRVANSPYYGLGGRVSTLPFAVSVVGFQAVRSLAVAAAAGIDRPDGAPAGFWEGAATTATASELVAPLLGANPGDAFSTGLLHTLGAALLHQHSPLPALCLPQMVDPAELCRHEVDTYGTTHAEAGAQVLAAWNFPPSVCEPIARHHEGLLPDASPLERCLHVGRALAERSLTQEPSGLATDDGITWLTQGRLTSADIEPLILRLQDKAEGLLEGLRPR